MLTAECGHWLGHGPCSGSRVALQEQPPSESRGRRPPRPDDGELANRHGFPIAPVPPVKRGCAPVARRWTPPPSGFGRIRADCAYRSGGGGI